MSYAFHYLILGWALTVDVSRSVRRIIAGTSWIIAQSEWVRRLQRHFSPLCIRLIDRPRESARQRRYDRTKQQQARALHFCFVLGALCFYCCNSEKQQCLISKKAKRGNHDGWSSSYVSERRHSVAFFAFSSFVLLKFKTTLKHTQTQTHTITEPTDALTLL